MPGPGHLSVEGLACERGGRRVFENLSFAVEAGRYVELRGPNGSGKSSLLRLLAGFDQPAAGTVVRPDTLTYVGHLDAIKPVLTVRENLTFWRNFFGDGDVPRALAAFSLEALADDPASFLSQGQKHRLSLARLALAHRSLWLLDEPTVGLDAASLGQLAHLARQHVEAGGIIIAATHADFALKPAATITLDSRT